MATMAPNKMIANKQPRTTPTTSPVLEFGFVTAMLFDSIALSCELVVAADVDVSDDDGGLIVVDVTFVIFVIFVVTFSVLRASVVVVVLFSVVLVVVVLAGARHSSVVVQHRNSFLQLEMQLVSSALGVKIKH